MACPDPPPLAAAVHLPARTHTSSNPYSTLQTLCTPLCTQYNGKVASKVLVGYQPKPGSKDYVTFYEARVTKLTGNSVEVDYTKYPVSVECRWQGCRVGAGLAQSVAYWSSTLVITRAAVGHAGLGAIVPGQVSPACVMGAGGRGE